MTFRGRRRGASYSCVRWHGGHATAVTAAAWLSIEQRAFGIRWPVSLALSAVLRVSRESRAFAVSVAAESERGSNTTDEGPAAGVGGNPDKKRRRPTIHCTSDRAYYTPLSVEYSILL